MEMSRGFGLYLLAILLVVVVACSVVISQPVISDTDPSTYAIIPLLMLPVFALFMLKEKEHIVPSARGNDVALGIMIFAAFIALILYMHSLLGPLFFSYRIDILLIPIAIAALAVLIFGSSNLGRFVPIALYALFASPLMFYPVVAANLNFASLNTVAIYYPAKLLFGGLTYSAPITLYLNGYAVSIGNTCIGLGALLALFMLLVPIAYLFDGKARDKALWLCLGIALMLALNYLRMLAITLAWFTYGPNAGILYVHSIAGQLIFYAIPVVMVLVAGKFGLGILRAGRSKGRYSYNRTGIAAAVILSVFALLVSLSYIGATVMPLVSIGQNPSFTSASESQLYSAYISYNGTAYSVLGNQSSSVAILLGNSTSTPVTFVFAAQNSTAEHDFLSNVSQSGWKEYLSGGNIAYVYGGADGYVYHAQVPYLQGGTYYVIDMYGVAPLHPVTGCIGGYDLFYDTITNLAELNINALSGSIDAGFCTISGYLK